jgi:hypothetical protein
MILSSVRSPLLLLPRSSTGNEPCNKREINVRRTVLGDTSGYADKDSVIYGNRLGLG